PAYQGAAPFGTCVKFMGEGGKLFVTYLLHGMLPMFGAYVVGGIVMGVGIGIDSFANIGIISAIFTILGILLMYIGLIAVQFYFMNKFFEFYYANLTLYGQQARYTGTFGALAKIQFVNT